MRGIVSEFQDGRGIIKPRDGGDDVRFSWPAILTADKSLAVADEVDYEVDTSGEATVVFKVH